MNKMNLYCIKCQNANIELKLDTDGMNSFYSNCVDCGFKKLTDIDRKDLNCYL